MWHLLMSNIPRGCNLWCSKSPRGCNSWCPQPPRGCNSWCPQTPRGCNSWCPKTPRGCNFWCPQSPKGCNFWCPQTPRGCNFGCIPSGYCEQKMPNLMHSNIDEGIFLKLIFNTLNKKLFFWSLKFIISSWKKIYFPIYKKLNFFRYSNTSSKNCWFWYFPDEIFFFLILCFYYVHAQKTVYVFG